MNLKKSVKALKDHAKEEVRIHSEIIKEADEDIKNLAKKHLADTVEIHKKFWKELKKSWKSK
jgi:gas vesicle protein